MPASLLPGLDDEELAAAVTGSADLDAAAAILDRTLTAVLPATVDPAVETVERAVRVVERDRSVLRVTDLAARLGLGTRSLQRLFARYVGVSPGWVIRRCRLQEVALRATEAGTSTGAPWRPTSATTTRRISYGTSRRPLACHPPGTAERHPTRTGTLAASDRGRSSRLTGKPGR